MYEFQWFGLSYRPMVGKSKSGLGFISGSGGFDLDMFEKVYLDLKVGLDLDLKVAGFAHHCYRQKVTSKTPQVGSEKKKVWLKIPYQ